VGISRWVRPVRVAACRLGLLDRTRGAARAVEHGLDGTGRTLVETSGVPGLAVLVRFGDGREVRRTWGRAGERRPMRTDTVVQALSLSKSVTAACALGLVQRGVLALDEPIFRRIRSWRLPPNRATPEQVEAITLRRLLSHTSGLNVLGYAQRPFGEEVRPASLLAREDEDERTIRVVRPAGTFGYSGGGFVVAQLAIEDATGRPYADVARETVLEPLGLSSSTYGDDVLAARVATAHDRDGRPVPLAPFAATAASGLWSDAEDLATFWSALVPGAAGEPAGRGVVSPASCAEMLRPHVLDREGAWGLGLRLKTKRGDLRYVHAGYDVGWHHYAEGLLRRRVVMVLVSNGDRGEDVVPALSRALRLTLYDRAL